MKFCSFLCSIFILSATVTTSQIVYTAKIYGKVVVDSMVVEKVNIVNTTTKKATISNKEGVFSIVVSVGDELILTSVNLEPLRKKIVLSDCSGKQLLFKMKVRINPLPEVVVNENSNVNAESLRIIPAGQKKYTPAEGKLYTARSGLIDPLLNKISGRTSQLKKELQVEHKEKLLLQLEGLYEEKYYTEVLKVPKDYIKGFQYYLVDDAEFVKALQMKNKTLTMFYVKRLALNYNQMLQEEKE